MKGFKKVLALLLALSMTLSLAACGNNNSESTTAASGNNDTTEAAGNETDAPSVDAPVVDIVEGDYTYHSYTAALGTNWNPHTWETNADDSIQSYVSAPLADLTIKDSSTGEYQWIFVAATDIQDVTAQHQDDLTKYNCTLPEGVTADQVTESYVYEISLRPEMCWEDGTPINADTYIYSMKALLDPAMKNYRANNYYSGESAIAGAIEYFNAGSTVEQDNGAIPMIAAKEDLVLGADGVYTTAEGGKVWIAPSDALDWLDGNSLADYVGAYADAMFDVDSFNALVNLADENGRVPATDEAWDLLVKVITKSADWGETEADAVNYLIYEYSYPDCEYDETVGVYKVDDYTIRYVCDTAYDYYYFLTSCTSNWIVNEALYEAGKDTTGTLVTTDYNSSKETTMSYGPYRIESLQDGKQLVFVQNENYFEYKTTESGYLYAATDVIDFTVDGEYVQSYQTQKIVIDVMTDDAAKQAFLKGELDDWNLSAEDAVTYATSDNLYKVDETYTMRLFFNCNLDSLKEMDKSYGNTNSVVMSNVNFRKALSLALDRTEFVSATAGYKAAYSMINSLYFYDVYEDPTSIYRNTDEAMQAICNLFGVEYGSGTPYATLKDAYDSINGYNLTEAKELMKQACDELVAEGLYKAGDPIVIRMGYKAGALDSTDNQQVSLLNKYINAAVEGSGFGTIELVAVDNLTNRYASVANGEFAIGWGAWGGAAFYPFTMFRVYCDPDYTSIHEAGCWDPATEELTLTIDGTEYTMTWQKWSTSMTGTGVFANADNETKLQVLAAIEENYLKLYYCIPVCTTTACSMLSYKVSYYTEDYNIMYGFGGMRLMSYNYTDAEWTDFVASQGSELSYE